MRQTDEILARFPGPARLTMSLLRRLLGLAIFVVLTAFMAWLLLGEGDRDRYLHGRGDLVMAWFSLAVVGAFAIRSLILLLVPGAASLTLDREGFVIGQVFRRIRTAWRDVSEIRVETKFARGGKLTQVVCDVAGANARRVVPPLYGLRRVHAEALAGLMNAWRERALAPTSGTIGDDDARRAG